MEGKNSDFISVDEYIASFPEAIQHILKELRVVIRSAAPGAEERISYQIPTFVLNGRNLVHYAAFKRHIGFYGASNALRAFAEELSGYISGKGTLKFPMDKPLPLELISRIVKFRVAENLQMTKASKSKRK